MDGGVVKGWGVEAEVVRGGDMEVEIVSCCIIKGRVVVE